MPSPRRRWIFRAVTVAVALVVSITIAETALLLSGVNNDYRDAGVSALIPRTGGPTEMSECGHVPYAKIRMRFPTNPRGYFQNDNTLDHQFNSVGWRDGEHALEKPEGTFRILGLGDSYLYGQGVKAEDRCLDRLPALLKSHWSAERFETINTGQPGFNTSQEMQLLKRCGWNYSPDLVLLCFVPNDLEPDIYTTKPKVEFFTEYTTSFLGTDWLSQHSELWSLARRKVWGQIKGRAYIQQSIDSFVTQPEKWDNCRQAIAEIAADCTERNVGFAVIVFPFFINLNGDYPFQRIHDRVTGYCSEAEIPCLDLRDAYRSFRGPELWVHPVDQHPNDRAHAIAADAIVRFLEEHRETLHLPPN